MQKNFLDAYYLAKNENSDTNLVEIRDSLRNLDLCALDQSFMTVGKL